MDMSGKDPFGTLLTFPELQDRVDAARSAIARAHRRPAVLRRGDVVSSESVLRGARAAVALGEGGGIPLADAEPAADSSLARAISAYSVLAPDRLDDSVRTFVRAPLQVIARLDVLAGGTRLPSRETGRLQEVARIIVTRPDGPAYDALLPAVVHAEIAGGELFGPRSVVIAHAAARLAAVATGFDPRGIAVPETYLNRHRAEYRRLLAGYVAGHQVDFFAQQLDAWAAGAKEADGIAKAA